MSRKDERHGSSVYGPGPAGLKRKGRKKEKGGIK